jgi:hypothetical protein
VSCSLPGVGVITAAAFRPELPEPRRFDHEGQVARMAGLAPQVRRSGETRREGGPLKLKSGNARLRTVPVEAAWRWARYGESAARRYRQPVADTGSGKKAVVAMARRLGVLLWQLSVHGEPYRAVARSAKGPCVDPEARTAFRVVSHRAGDSEDLRAWQTAFRSPRALTRDDRRRRPLATASLISGAPSTYSRLVLDSPDRLTVTVDRHRLTSGLIAANGQKPTVDSVLSSMIRYEIPALPVSKIAPLRFPADADTSRATGWWLDSLS